MQIIHHTLKRNTDSGIEIYDLTPEIREKVTEFCHQTGAQNGQILVSSLHTTTALAVNEYEVRLLQDLKVWLKTLAPPMGSYRHNDLHLRDVPEDEPINAHSHLMAIALSNSQVIPLVNGALGLGQWQSVLLFELDGPRSRSMSLQIWGV